MSEASNITLQQPLFIHFVSKSVFSVFYFQIPTQTDTIHMGVCNLPHKFHLYLICTDHISSTVILAIIATKVKKMQCNKEGDNNLCLFSTAQHHND